MITHTGYDPHVKGAFPHHSYAPLSPSSNASQPHTTASKKNSWSSSFANAVLSGRIPLCLVLVFILGFILYHLATDSARQKEDVLRITLQQSERQMQEHAAQLEQRATTISNPRQRLPVKSSYRCLIVGDSLTVGYYWSEDEHENHPYLLYLEQLLLERHPNLKFEFVMDAEGGECVISKCTTKSMIARVTEQLARSTPKEGEATTHAHDSHGHDDPLAQALLSEEGFDLAIILGGTNDIFHDFSALDIAHGLEAVHKMIWTSTPPGVQPKPGVPHAKPKTIALTIPQWGTDDAWRPPKKQSKLHPTAAAAARGTVNKMLLDFCLAETEQCTPINLDEWFPRWSLTSRELERKWAENVHPSPFGYDEIGLIIYQHLKHILPQN